MPRCNIYLSEVTDARVRRVLERVDFKLSNLVEATALCLSEEELTNLRKRYEQMKRIEVELNGTLTQEIITRLKGMNADQLKQVLQSVIDAGAKTEQTPAG